MGKLEERTERYTIDEIEFVRRLGYWSEKNKTLAGRDKLTWLEHRLNMLTNYRLCLVARERTPFHKIRVLNACNLIIAGVKDEIVKEKSLS